MVVLVGDDLEQLCRAVATLSGDNTELGHVSAVSAILACTSTTMRRMK